MSVAKYISLVITQFNTAQDIDRAQGITIDDIRFGVRNGNVTELWYENRQKAKLDKIECADTLATILAAINASGYTQNGCGIYNVTKLKHGGTATYSPAKEFLLNNEYFKDFVTIPVTGGTRLFYNVEEEKTPWILELEEELNPSDTATSTSTAG